MSTAYKGQTHHELKWSERGGVEEWSCKNCTFVTIDEQAALDHSRMPLKEHELYVDPKETRLKLVEGVDNLLEEARVKIEHNYKTSRNDGTFQLLEAVEQLSVHAKMIERGAHQ